MKLPRWLLTWLPAIALAVGLGLGLLVGAAAFTSDPTSSPEYRALQEELEERESSVDGLVTRATRAEAALRDRDVAAAELQQREAAVAAREQAVAATEQAIAATSVGEGIWTVGVDVEPGTYRTREALTGYCYWAIYRTGSNGDDIVDNDGPQGGLPDRDAVRGARLREQRVRHVRQAAVGGPGVCRPLRPPLSSPGTAACSAAQSGYGAHSRR